MKWLRTASIYGTLFGLLTILTQVGGVLILGAWWLLRRRWFSSGRYARLYAAGGAVAVYLLCTLILVPPIAGLFGRQPLPVFASQSTPLAPRCVWYWVLNRHYVTTELKEVVVRSARELNKAHPGSVVQYLDAGFPFVEGFPLLPHLSHDDGRKIDFTYCYRLQKRPERYTSSPSPIGYWIYEAPKSGEAAPYADRDCLLRWDFGWIQGLNRHREFDPVRTRTFLRILLAQPETERILLELHLQNRLGLADSKLRFQQCQAARHDDHIHYQVVP